MALIALFCVSIGIGALKLRQDQRKANAISELQRIGFQTTIGSSDGRAVLSLRYVKSAFADEDVVRLLKHIDALNRRHDLGISSGLEIRLLDFTGCSVSKDAIAELRTSIPDAQLRH